MKIRTTALGAVILLACACSQSAGTKATVDIADLAPLGAARLSQLSQHENELSTARAMLAAAKNAEAEAKDQVKAAKRTIEAEVADKKAAEAELAAAKKNNDPGRGDSARKLVASTTHDLKVARELLDWRQQDVKACNAEVDAAEAKVDFASAELELARVRLLAESDSAASAAYDPAVFAARASDARAKYDQLLARAQRERAQATQLKENWARLAGEPEPLEPPLE